MDKYLPSISSFDGDTIKPFSKIKLIVMDLDGTLLSSGESDMPQKMLDFSRKFKYSKNDIKLTFATGRTLNGTRKLLEKIKIQNKTPIILYNGSVVLDNKYNLLLRHTIMSSSVEEIFKLACKYKITVLSYCYQGVDASSSSEVCYGLSKFEQPKYDYNKLVVNWFESLNNYVVHEPSAIVIHLHDEDRKCIRKNLSDIDGISIMDGSSYIEVVPIGVNKGKTLEYVTSKFMGYLPDEVLAIGDNDNDAEMLSWAGIGVALENASDLAKAHSRYVSRMSVLEGASEVLRIVRTAKRLYGQKQ